jgi:hypothetical protein
MVNSNSLNVNQGIEANVKDRDSARRKAKDRSDNYSIKLKNAKGEDYKVVYYFS